MAEGTMRERHLEALLERIQTDPYPSAFHLDLVESMIAPEEIDPYLAILLDKVAAERFPSNQMLTRIHRLAAMAPRSG